MWNQQRIVHYTVSGRQSSLKCLWFIHPIEGTNHSFFPCLIHRLALTVLHLRSPGFVDRPVGTELIRILKQTNSQSDSICCSRRRIIQSFFFRTFMAFRFPVGQTTSQAPQPLHFAGSTPGKDSYASSSNWTLIAL